MRAAKEWLWDMGTIGSIGTPSTLILIQDIQYDAWREGVLSTPGLLRKSLGGVRGYEELEGFLSSNPRPPTAIDALKEIEAEEKLRSRGYFKSKCTTCYGEGFFWKTAKRSSFFRDHNPPEITPIGCPKCDGAGHTWKRIEDAGTL